MRATRIAGEPLAQRLDDRDAAGDRRLEIERHAVLLGERRERDAVARQQRLVGGDHRLAGRERGLDRAPWPDRPSPPISSTKTSISGSARERDRIVDPAQLLQVDAALLAARARA